MATTGIRNPSLIHQVDPEYPELGRVARLEATVILQAMIRTDGTVGELQVMKSNRPRMGFEEAAIEAVSRWRFEPARRIQDETPIDVYFTVFVDFKLH